MRYTLVPVIREHPLTFGADYLAVDDAEGEAWKKAIQQVHPRLLPQLKESALVAEEDSPFCVAGGLFEYKRGQELVFDGTEYVLSHCAEHFMDAMMSPGECLRVTDEHRETLRKLNVTDDASARYAALRAWWEQGYPVLFLQHR